MNYTGIEKAGKALAGLLKAHMVPDMVKSAELIGAAPPGDKNDLSVGIWLYDIRECAEIGDHSMISQGTIRQRFPSVYVNLYYAVTAYSTGDVRYRAAEEQMILGKILQVFHENAVLKELGGIRHDTGEELLCSLTLLNLPMEEKIRIVSIPGTGYKTSLFYEAGPVEIESESSRSIQRVVDAAFYIEETAKRKGRKTGGSRL